MCGIFAVHGLDEPSSDRVRFLACSKKQRHRGPDWSGCFVGQKTVLVHERLAIVGVGEHAAIVVQPFFDPASEAGAQPLLSEDGKIILAVNGEIYNHVALRASVGQKYKFKTNSDCEVIIPLVWPTSCIRYLLD